MDIACEIKQEPWYTEMALTEMKSEPEENLISIDGLQHEVDLVKEFKDHIVMYNDNKVNTDIEIKEEPLIGDPPSVTSDCIRQNDEEGTASCITGIAEDFPSTESSKLHTEPACCDASLLLGSHKETRHKFSVRNSPYLKHKRMQKSEKEFNICAYGNKKRYKCNTCKMGFISMSSLKRHNFVHIGTKLHKCEICDKTFVTLFRLKRHILVHDGVKPYKCQICETSFVQLSTLNKHMITHKNKKHKCETCDKNFSNAFSFKKHIMIHENKTNCGTSVVCLNSKVFVDNMEDKLEHYRHVILFYFRKGKTTSQTQKKICAVYGENAVTDRTCRKWFSRFRDGNFSLKDKPRKGRPVVTNVERIQHLICNNPKMTTREMAQELNISNASVSRYLKKLGYRNVCDMWVTTPLNL